jgi:rare lipoprotein A
VRVNDRGPFAQEREIDLSYKTAQLLGFHGRGLAKVKVDYVGRAPLAGSDDRKLLATLREGDKPATMLAENTAPARQTMTQAAASKPAPVEEVAEEEEAPQAPVRVATADKGFAPAFFDSRPLASRKTISQDNSTPKLMPRAPTTELAANTRLRPTDVAASVEPAPAVSPVSAYAPTRYDQPAAFMSGRGLY